MLIAVASVMNDSIVVELNVFAGTRVQAPSTELPEYALTSLVLVALVASGTIVVGVACSWLVASFEFPGRRSAATRVVFGHWSTLELHARVSPRHRVYPLDTGCVWGGPLTALRLDDEQWFAVDCPKDRAS